MFLFSFLYVLNNRINIYKINMMINKEFISLPLNKLLKIPGLFKPIPRHVNETKLTRNRKYFGFAPYIFNMPVLCFVTCQPEAR